MDESTCFPPIAPLVFALLYLKGLFRSLKSLCSLQEVYGG
jgi:hypothetical protein